MIGKRYRNQTIKTHVTNEKFEHVNKMKFTNPKCQERGNARASKAFRVGMRQLNEFTKAGKKAMACKCVIRLKKSLRKPEGSRSQPKMVKASNEYET
jgi:hypothetical protein